MKNRTFLHGDRMGEDSPEFYIIHLEINLYKELFTLSTDFSTPGKTLSEKGFPHYAPVFPQGANAVLHRNRKVNIIYIM